MKKFTAILLTLLMAVSLAACAGDKEPAEEKTSEAEAAAENVSAENDSPENTSPEEVSEPEGAEAPSESAPENGSGENKILVAYFSATNTTEGVAKEIADSLSADLYEIMPEEPYTDADLNYNDDNSRSTIEMNDPAVRPAISGSVENMEQYNIVFIGYPIWWSEAPRIMSTFVESYDFSGKTIVPFCTSGGSGVGLSAANLEALTEGAEWLSGTRLNGGSSHEEIADWVNGLGLDITAE